MAKMGSGSVYRGQEMIGSALHREGISQQAIEALFASASAPPPLGFQGSMSMMSFEDFGANAIPRQYEVDDMCEDDVDEFGLQRPEKKRRLTVDQVQFLEKSFELENKLEPERKLQLAKDLGLQPRQVAIWFQNRRARWKTKQIEKDFDALQSSFNALKNDYDNLSKEKEELKSEVQVLREKLILQEKGISGSNNGNTSSSPSLPVQLSPLPPPQAVCRQEDLCSTNSAVLDYESSHYAEEAWHSDLSQPEEDDGEKLESSSYREFEDTPLWFWP